MTHLLAVGESRTHPHDDCVRAAEAIGAALDARIAGLATLDAPSPAAHAELLDLLHAVGRAATSAGPWPEVLAWEHAAFAMIKGHADRLFGEHAPEINIPTGPAPAGGGSRGSTAGALGADFWRAFGGR